MFNLKFEEEIFSHIIDANFYKILIINNSVNVVISFKRFRLDIIKKFEKHDCYMIFEHGAHFAAKNWENNKFKFKLKIITLHSKIFAIIDDKSVENEWIINTDITIFEIK